MKKLFSRLVIDRKRYPNASTPLEKLSFRIWRKPTASWRSLPDFVIIGVQKGGTSSLFRYLAQHPGLCMAYRKQVHFFDRFWYRGENWYKACFCLSANAPRLVGEATPYYFFHPHVPERMKSLLPRVKLILMLRNPVDRAYSHFRMKRDQGHEPEADFERALALEEERIAGEWKKMMDNPRYYSLPCRQFSYLRRSYYDEQLARWLEYFPLDQFLFIQSERFFENPVEVLRQLYDFLGIDDHIPSELRAFNSRQYAPLSPDLRKKLQAHFAPHNRRLEALSQCTFDWSS